MNSSQVLVSEELLTPREAEEIRNPQGPKDPRSR